MSEMRRRAASGLKAGDTFTVTRTFTRAETEAFGDLTRDYNPVHYDARFAESRGLKGLICHGLLSGSLICEVGGQIGWLASGMSFRFLKPVTFGERITCTFSITSLDERGSATARAEYVDEGGALVLSAELTGFLPGPASRAVLGRMIEEGDPTNGLGRRDR